jgi:hypothetical protein
VFHYDQVYLCALDAGYGDRRGEKEIGIASMAFK